MLIVGEQPLEDQATELDPAYAQFRDQTRFWIQRVAVPMLMVIGLFGNSITMIIMTRRGMRSTTNMYLAALAFVDMLYLVLTFLLGLSHYPNMAGPKYYAYWKLRPFLMMLTDACSNTSVWLTVTFTIERYIAVKYPMKANVWCTEARAKMLIVFVFMFGILFATPVPFEWKVIEKRITTITSSLLKSSATPPTPSSSSSSSSSSSLPGYTQNNSLYSINRKGGQERLLQPIVDGDDSPVNIQSTIQTFVTDTTDSDSEKVTQLFKTESDVNVNDNDSYILALDYSDFGKNETYKTVYYWSTAVIFYFIPLFSLMLFNGFLIKSVHQSQRERTKMTRRVTGCMANMQPVTSSLQVPPTPLSSPMLDSGGNAKLKTRTTSVNQISDDQNSNGGCTSNMKKFSLNWPKNRLKLFLPASVSSNLYKLQTTKIESPTVSSSVQDEESLPQESNGQKCPLIEWHCNSNNGNSDSTRRNLSCTNLDGDLPATPLGKQHQSIINALPFVDDVTVNSTTPTTASKQNMGETRATFINTIMNSNNKFNLPNDQTQCDNEQPIVGNEAEKEQSTNLMKCKQSIASQQEVQNKTEVSLDGIERAKASGIIKSTEALVSLAAYHKKTSATNVSYQASNLTGPQQSQPQIIVPASSQERRITIMLIAVVILFLVCQIPSAAMLLYTSVHELMPNTNEHALVLAFGNIFNFLMAVNAAGNFILYSFLSKKYRRTFVILFCSCLGSGRQKQQQKQHHQPHNQANRLANSSNNLRFEPSPGPSQRNSTSIFQNSKSRIKTRRDTLV